MGKAAYTKKRRWQFVLCGGEWDGKIMSCGGYRPNFVEVKWGELQHAYIAKRYASPWPIVNWLFFVDYDPSLDEPGNEGEAYTPWWTTWVMATEERHQEIEESISYLSAVVSLVLDGLEHGYYLPRHGTSDTLDVDIARVERRLKNLYRLTHNEVLS